MALAPTATQISVRDVLAKFEVDFAPMARAVENGEFALWVGSGISRRAPNLGDLIERAFEFIRVRAIDPETTDDYMPALQEALELAGVPAGGSKVLVDRVIEASERGEQAVTDAAGLVIGAAFKTSGQDGGTQ